MLLGDQKRASVRNLKASNLKVVFILAEVSLPPGKNLASKIAAAEVSIEAVVKPGVLEE